MFGKLLKITRLFFFKNRSPDTAKVKQKMLYAASKDALRKKLDGIYTEIQCTDLSEVSYETVLDKVLSNFLSFLLLHINITLLGFSYDYLNNYPYFSLRFFWFWDINLKKGV